jgi:hypothetical protein
MGRVLGNPFGLVLLILSISLVFTLVAGCSHAAAIPTT